jgi:uncharacterized protein
MGNGKSQERWFFATDVHGSDRCYRKFLAAARVYEADVLVLGGDVAGKGIVPIVRTGDERWRIRFQGTEDEIRTEQLDEYKQRVALNGLYPYVCEPENVEKLHDTTYRDGVFEQLIAEQLREWIKLTEERLADHVRCIITPGNDDPPVIDTELTGLDRIECPERELVDVGPVRLASLGNTNVTPWHTDREYSEEELTAQIEEMLGDPADHDKPLVLNFHCPPYGSGLDVAAQLDKDFRPVMRSGGIVQIPVGSRAVRAAVERYQPVVGLHGHIHESQGIWRSGTSRCFNPGSDYSSGLLKGLIVDFDSAGEYRDHLFTSG